MWSNSFIQRLIVAETYFLSSIDATEHDIEKFYREACCIAFIETFAGTAECQEVWKYFPFSGSPVGCSVLLNVAHEAATAYPFILVPAGADTVAYMPVMSYTYRSCESPGRFGEPEYAMRKRMSPLDTGWRLPPM